MNRTLRTALLPAILVALLASLAGLADSGVAPLGIVPTPTPSPLSATIATNKTSYVIGENVIITYTISMPAYVYIYDIQPDGIVRLIFPNQYSMSNYKPAGTHSLPDGAYKFTAYPPTGTEQLQIIASGVPLNLAPTAYSEPFPMVGPNPGVAAMGIQAQIKGILPEPLWATGVDVFPDHGLRLHPASEPDPAERLLLLPAVPRVPRRHLVLERGAVGLWHAAERPVLVLRRRWAVAPADHLPLRRVSSA